MGHSDGGAGCGILGLVVVLALLVLAGVGWAVGELAKWNDAEASRLYARGALEESYGRAQAEIERAQADARAAIITAESQARLDYAIAEAQMVLAQGQNRLDSAQAFAVTAGASLPWMVTMLVASSGMVLIAAILAIVSLALAAISGRRQQTSYLRPPGPQIVVERPGRRALTAPEAEEGFVEAFVIVRDDLDVGG
jgi:hypothetical protein